MDSSGGPLVTTGSLGEGGRMVRQRRCQGAGFDSGERGQGQGVQVPAEARNGKNSDPLRDSPGGMQLC